MKIPHRTKTVLAIVAACILPPIAVAANPEEPGPYPVGVTTIALTDLSRMDPGLEAPRPLLAEFWYPAAASARNGEPTEFVDFYLGGENAGMNAIIEGAFKFDLDEINETFKTIAVRDAAIATGTFPLLIFSHGNGGMRAQNTFWCDHLASHGYIVAAVDHTGNAIVTSHEGTIIPYDTEGRASAARERPKDVSFLIDAVAKMNADADSRFHERVDLEHIGVAGHSFGGFTAMAAAAQDPRIDAIAPMAATVPEFTDSSSVPLLLFIATEDGTIGAKGNAATRDYYEATDAPKYLVELKNAGHYSFSDMYQINPAWGDGVGRGERITNGKPIEYIGMKQAYALTNGYSTAFFHAYLKNDHVFADYLRKNQAPDDVLYRSAAAERAAVAP